MSNLKSLMTPFKIGNVEIKNRYCMGPMGGGHHFEADGTWKESTIEYYAARARGGFGLIFGGVMTPDKEVESPGNSSPLLNPVRWRVTGSRLAEKIHAQGAKMFPQLTMGYGRNYPGMLSPSESEVYMYPELKSPVLTTDQIKKKIEQIIEAAKIVKSADFDGVEVHSIHWGYLLDQFAMALTNRREDEYGGSLENRLRVCKEIIQGIKAECGSDFPVTMRMSLKTYLKGFNKASFDGRDEAGRTLEEGIEICKLLESYGYDALSVDVGTYDSFYYACPPCYVPGGHGLELYAEAKKAVNIPILAGSRMGNPFLCAEALEQGKADAFVLSRPSLADPDLPNKVARGIPEKIRPCIGCNQGCVGRLLEKGLPFTCAVNPRAFRETETPVLPALKRKKIVVAGGGAAGMEAARTAAMRGHEVVLFEKSGVLGGDLIPAGSHSFKKEIRQLNEWYKSEMQDLPVDVRMHTEATPDVILAEKPDTVILATGAQSVMPGSIRGIDSEKAASSIDVLVGKKEAGNKVVVVGGGNVGLEIAIEYAMEGRQVTVVEALPELLEKGDFVPQQNRMWIMDAIEYYGVNVRTSAVLQEINEEGAVIRAEGSEKEETLPADTVVCALGFRSGPSMREALSAYDVEIYEVGNGVTPSNIIAAIGTAFEVARNL
ncbi:MAG: FAD-dependent oxidoreductase [Firmicutes bacterium]|nr:FAD-dependent oxidoreductase [Bacillota bacterium]